MSLSHAFPASTSAGQPHSHQGSTNDSSSHNSAIYWLVACSLEDTQSSAQVLTTLQRALLSPNPRSALCGEVCELDIPQLKFGAFDDLIRSVDSLQKHDAFVEGVLKRVLRQAAELDPAAAAEPKIFWQRRALSVAQYLRRFVWDDAKFPRSRFIKENTEAILLLVQKTDEDLRGKLAPSRASGEAASGGAGLKREDAATAARMAAGGGLVNFVVDDLLDILTPQRVDEKDFFSTLHLTTAVVVVPRGREKEWEDSYESLDPFVVPRSSHRFNTCGEDMEGNSLWSVTLFKQRVPLFIKAASSKKFTVRQFAFSAAAYQAAIAARSRAAAEHSRQQSFLCRVCFAAFSDIFIAWLHLKAMRIFCEAVLRFGVPPQFAAFLLRPLAGESKEKKLRKELDRLFAPTKSFGNRYFANANQEDSLADGEEEFYSYIWLSLQPFGSGHK